MCIRDSAYTGHKLYWSRKAPNSPSPPGSGRVRSSELRGSFRSLLLRRGKGGAPMMGKSVLLVQPNSPRVVPFWVSNLVHIWSHFWSKFGPNSGPILVPFLGSTFELFWLQNDAILNLKMISERSRKQIANQQFNSSQINRSQINRSRDYRSTDSQTRDQQIYQIDITD